MELTTYDDVNKAWRGEKLPSITATSAAPLFRKLVRKFGGRNIPMPFYSRQVNRSWAAPSGSDTTQPRVKGLPRMVHDASHWVFYKLHPTFKTHSAAHADLEKQMIECVLTNEWHKPVSKTVPTLDERHAVERLKVEASIKRWEIKAKRAATALRKLRLKHRRLSK